MDALTIRPVTAREPAVAALIARHFELMRAGSPEESCHVMSTDALERDGVWMVAAGNRSDVLAVGGLKQIGPGHGEIKSMHTAEAARGRGLGRAVLHALIAEARVRGMTRLSLETGAAATFAAARELYASEDFIPCGPFGSYVPDPLSVFMTRII